MDTDQITLSPAKRARRCVLNLLVCLVVVVGVYAGFHSDRWPFKGNGVVIAVSSAAPGGGTLAALKSPPGTPNDAQVSVPVQLSMAESIASAYLVIPRPKP